MPLQLFQPRCPAWRALHSWRGACFRFPQDGRFVGLLGEAISFHCVRYRHRGDLVGKRSCYGGPSKWICMRRLKIGGAKPVCNNVALLISVKTGNPAFSVRTLRWRAQGDPSFPSEAPC